MAHKIIKPLTYFIMALALIGIGVRLFTDTTSFLMDILVTVLFAAVIIGIVYFIFSRRNGGTSNEMKQYRKAARQSKQKYKQPTTSSTIAKKMKPSTIKSKVASKKQKQRKEAPHLRVIEGNKSKKKNRASF
ncbi:hypothetical protein N780_16440 [Pontibacillus chungwhensis BH030062]|uniref:Uncharacterized protein n=1 Tax=Pontibacillus chungwhensis BH030062 TaxID=1385513 RepID=A0A0A2UVJ7_9BACI|nr:SA1362 family protein [Pontibacillus chungwhensis]KGP91934.1 hypothetical protein N780_16440 [Pontibacillus chungwhensis BH030062]